MSFKKTITRLRLTVLIFFLSWFVSQVLGLIILEISNYPKWLGMLLVFFLCLSYSNTFYVTLLKSKEYRDQFCSLWCIRKSTSSGIAIVNSQSMSQKYIHPEVKLQKRNDTW
ncbi:unnamed protein product [Caenorhabditis nigoni]